MSDDFQQALLSLIQDNKTLALATLNKEQHAEASSTPYVFHGGDFWIFVSQLSSHTENLLRHKKASVLIVEPQHDNVFAPTRATIQCTASITEGLRRETILDLMTEQLGETVTMLRQLPDFYLIKLQPKNGRFIAGFGKAFDIAFPELHLVHVQAKN